MLRQMTSKPAGIQARRDGLAMKREAHRQEVLDRKRNFDQQKSVQQPTPLKNPTFTAPKPRETPDQRKVRLQRYRDMKSKLNERQKQGSDLSTPAFRAGIAPMRTPMVTDSSVKSRRALNFGARNVPETLKPSTQRVPAIRSALASRFGEKAAPSTVKKALAPPSTVKSKTPMNGGIKDVPEKAPDEEVVHKAAVPSADKPKAPSSAVKKPSTTPVAKKKSPPSSSTSAKRGQLVTPRNATRTVAARKALEDATKKEIRATVTPKTSQKATPVKSGKKPNLVSQPSPRVVASHCKTIAEGSNLVSSARGQSLEGKIPALRRKVLAQKNDDEPELDIGETPVKANAKAENLRKWNELMAKIKGGKE